MLDARMRAVQNGCKKAVVFEEVDTPCLLDD